MTPITRDKESFTIREIVREHIDTTTAAMSETNRQLNELNIKIALVIQKNDDKEKSIEKHEAALIEIDRRHHEQKGAFWLLGVSSAAIGSLFVLFAKKILHL